MHNYKCTQTLRVLSVLILVGLFLVFLNLSFYPNFKDTICFLALIMLIFGSISIIWPMVKIILHNKEILENDSQMANGIDAPTAVTRLFSNDICNPLLMCIMLIIGCWFTFALFIAILAAPEYLSSRKNRSSEHRHFVSINLKQLLFIAPVAATSENIKEEDNSGALNENDMQIVHLVHNDDHGSKKLLFLKVLIGSLYYSAVTFCTIGYGDIYPGVNGLWAKTGSTFMAIFIILSFQTSVQFFILYLGQKASPERQPPLVDLASD